MRADPVDFADRQLRAQQTARAVQDQRATLDAKYGDRRYCSTRERRALDVLDRAERRAWDAFWRYLCAISPRDWAAGVPVVWLRDSLTFADAVTRGPLSVVPPPAYGYDDRAMRQYAAQSIA